MLNRRAAREAALQAIYAVELGGNTTQDAIKNIIKERLKDDTDGVKFAEKLLLLAVDQKKEFDQIISGHINNWEVNRLATIDKLILRMAICELLNFEQVPTKVSINEAIELAKNFSTRKSGNFVNGILDSVLQDFIRENKIVKKGKGLIEFSQN